MRLSKHEQGMHGDSHSAKTLNFFVATSALRLLTAELKDFAFPSGDAVIAHCSLGLRSGRLRGALFHNARSPRCAQNVFAKHLKAALNLATYTARASPLGDCARPRLQHRLRVWFVGKCDHLRRPRGAFGRSEPMLPFGKPDAPLRVRRSSRAGS